MNLSLFASAFAFIFMASLPGRTTFLMLLMAARARPWALFWGAIAAFAVQSVISVTLGSVISFLPPAVIHSVVALLFFYFSFHFWKESKDAQSDEPAALAENTFKAAFLIIFAGEWGDVSQVAIATFAARSTEKITVLVSALAALWTIVILAVSIGSRLGKVFHPGKIQKVAAVGFALTGIYLLLIALNELHVF
jgi:putative Ca2+/H+ antiporter (TMEM165/GDT1 family)